MGKLAYYQDKGRMMEVQKMKAICCLKSVLMPFIEFKMGEANAMKGAADSKKMLVTDLQNELISHLDGSEPSIVDLRPSATEALKVIAHFHMLKLDHKKLVSALMVLFKTEKSKARTRDATESQVLEYVLYSDPDRIWESFVDKYKDPRQAFGPAQKSQVVARPNTNDAEVCSCAVC